MEDPEYPAVKRRGKTPVFVLLLIAIIVVLLVLHYMPSSTEIIRSGSVEKIDIGHYEYFKFDTSSGGKVTGSLSSDYNLSVYLVNRTQFGFDSKYVTFVKNSYSIMDFTREKFSHSVQAGTWYVVLVNPNTSHNDTVTVNFLKFLS